jgi:hypothetical protein
LGTDILHVVSEPKMLERKPNLEIMELFGMAKQTFMVGYGTRQ